MLLGMERTSLPLMPTLGTIVTNCNSVTLKLIFAITKESTNTPLFRNTQIKSEISFLVFSQNNSGIFRTHLGICRVMQSRLHRIIPVYLEQCIRFCTMWKPRHEMNDFTNARINTNVTSMNCDNQLEIASICNSEVLPACQTRRTIRIIMPFFFTLERYGPL